MSTRLANFKMNQPRVFAVIGDCALDESGCNTTVFDMSSAISKTRFMLSGAVFFSADVRRRSSPLDSPELLEQQEAHAMARAWRKGMFDLDLGSEPVELDQTVSALFRVLLRFGPTQVDLRDLPSTRVNAMHLTAVLGATYHCRDDVRGWREALTVAREALVREGIDPDDALGGLDEE